MLSCDSARANVPRAPRRSRQYARASPAAQTTHSASPTRDALITTSVKTDRFTFRLSSRRRYTGTIKNICIAAVTDRSTDVAMRYPLTAYGVAGFGAREADSGAVIGRARVNV